MRRAAKPWIPDRNGVAPFMQVGTLTDSTQPHPAMNPSNHDHCIKVCNSLLRGELSAVETYDQAIRKYAGTHAVQELRRIRDEHEKSANRLSQNVRSMGGLPDPSSGVWGLVATAIQGTADLFGAGSALESLKKGEMLGRHGYHEALIDEGVMPECKSLIHDELLPRIHEHLAALDRLQPTS